MIILFEEYHYRTTELSKVLSERYFFPINSVYSKINFVGYYFNPKINNGEGDSVIIFPKVFIDENNLAFGEYSPEELIIQTDEIKKRLTDGHKSNLIFEISTWLYRSIQQFNRRQSNTISELQNINQIVSNLDLSSNTELDLILSLIDFNKKNQNLFTFISKSSHSQNNKINWRKTINKSTPFLQNGKPFYLDFSTLKKSVNDSEELIVIFYSVLNHFKEKYSFEINIPTNYDLIKRNKFETLKRQGCKILKNIKYKYYSDKLISLYNLMYAYFERTDKTYSKSLIEEVLLIKDFNIVFEDMIDDLIGDKNVFPELKNHSDGKQIDHIYKYDSLIYDDEIYFVGDSKYYRSPGMIGKYSQAKQFTYARNVIQYNIDLFNNLELDKSIRYREEESEGYNITPNFFISSSVNKDLDFSCSNLEQYGSTKVQYHFKNRLFDRDTLFVQSYNINFLYVLSSYVSRNSSLKSSFKKDTQKKFRNLLIKFINEKYTFFKINPNSENFLQQFFKLLNGKIYKPSKLDFEFILAFERSSDFQEILNQIKSETKELIQIELG
ncbi:LlaJI family restriction endonuclease [Aquirufa sp. ROCK-SH2]